MGPQKKERRQNVVTRRTLLQGIAATSVGAAAAAGHDLYQELTESDTGLIPVGRVTAATVSQDEQMNNGGDDGGVVQSNLSFTEILETETIQSGDPFGYSLFSTDGEILAWNNRPGKAILYDTQNSELKWERSIPPGDPNNAVIDNNGNPIINTSDSLAKLSNQTGETIQEVPGGSQGGHRRYGNTGYAVRSEGLIKYNLDDITDNQIFDIPGGGWWRGGLIKLDDENIVVGPAASGNVKKIDSNTGEVKATFEKPAAYNRSIASLGDYVAVTDDKLHILDQNLEEIASNEKNGVRNFSSPVMLEEDGELKVYLGDWYEGTVEGHSLNDGVLERDFITDVGGSVLNTTVVGDVLISSGANFTLTNRHTGDIIQQYTDMKGLHSYPQEDMIVFADYFEDDGDGYKTEILYMNEEDIGGGGQEPANLELGGFEGIPDEVQLGNSFEYGISVTNTGGREADAVIQHFLTSGDADEVYKVEVDDQVPAETAETYAFTADTERFEEASFEATGRQLTYPILVEGEQTTVTLEAVIPETPEETDLRYADQRLERA